jgi:hypothetical protein
MPDAFLLYGSYGYTGRLIAARALERGLRPVLAGRARPGFSTPSLAFGPDWVLGFGGVIREDLP